MIVYSKRVLSAVTQTILRTRNRNVTTQPKPHAHFVRFSINEQVLFAKRLSFLVQAGISVHESLEIIRNQTKSKRKQSIFDAIIAEVTAGQSLSTSMSKYPRLFGAFTINLIRIGEHSGVLSENLLYLADELSKKQALIRKVRGALIYPLFITVATLAVTGLLIVFIFPKIMPIFLSLNITLPLTTRILLAVSVYLTHYGLVTIIGLVVLCSTFIFIKKYVAILTELSDRVLLYLPIIGTVTQLYNCANFCRTLGLSLQSGIVLSEALLITESVTKNTVYKKAYKRCSTHVTKGETISSVMYTYPSLFPDMLSHLIHIGEKTGNLSGTLGYLATLYETEIDERTKNLSNSIEPLLLVTMGLIVGLIAEIGRAHV